MIQPYFNIREKEASVNVVDHIFSDEDFERFNKTIIESALDSDLLWRGMGDANLKLYNSCQRYFNRISTIEDPQQYIDLIRNLLNYVSSWNNGTVNNYLESQNVFNDPVALMTLMQHFGFPTPMLDFSRDPFVALYFSSGSSNFDPSSEDIRNFSSLYCLNIKNKNLQLFDDTYRTHHAAYRDQFAQLIFTQLLRISDDRPEYKVGTSLNIINQVGSFIYSNSPSLPLEKMIGKDGKTEDGIYTFRCWHIHKKFNHRIRVLLDRDFLINQNYVFPDLYKMIDDFNHGR